MPAHLCPADKGYTGQRLTPWGLGGQCQATDQKPPESVPTCAVLRTQAVPRCAFSPELRCGGRGPHVVGTAPGVGVPLSPALILLHTVTHLQSKLPVLFGDFFLRDLLRCE